MSKGDLTYTSMGSTKSTYRRLGIYREIESLYRVIARRKGYKFFMGESVASGTIGYFKT